VNLKAVTSHRNFRPAVGATLAIVCGLFLLLPHVGERWINFSYDNLFLFGAKEVSESNKVVLILMDNDACQQLKQVRTEWSRELHAQMLRLLTRGGAAVVVFDVIFDDQGNRPMDLDLAAAMRENKRIVIGSDLEALEHPLVDGNEPSPPPDLFQNAAAAHGIAQCEKSDFPRRHWPLPTDNEDIVSLPMAAARLAGAPLDRGLQERWLRYYGEREAWQPYSYHLALSNSPIIFSNKVVFIGRSPKTDDPGIQEGDKFCLPRTALHPTPKGIGGVKILATTFLNLMNGDWLRRAPDWVEMMVLLLTGLLFGAGLSYARPSIAWSGGVAAGVLLLFGAGTLSYHTNYWFPWAIIAGGQIPCALCVNLVGVLARRNVVPVATSTLLLPLPAQQHRAPADGSAPVPLPASALNELPDAPDYQIFDPPFGQGGYGKVWLVRNAIGQWQALKAVYQKKFGADAGPYDREFNGIKRYKPISQKHPGLLCVDFVSTKKEAGYFYYVMELGDSVLPGWETDPSRYIPRDLSRIRAAAPGRRLPVNECARIGIVLAEALDFLHQQGLTHRDIKPQNIIFVKDQPKLADVGLVADIQPAGKENSLVGTLGYMPPPRESVGTVQADIYGLGMVLYVIRTGQEPALFPEVSTTLIGAPGPDTFLPLNAVILKACQPDVADRYSSAAELRAALLEVEPRVSNEHAKA
jgi:CHASE2 domain-containing sensor protein